MAIRIGILGFGGMGNWHADDAPKVESVEVVCVHDIDPTRLADARRRGLRAYERRSLPLPEVIGNWTELYKNLSDALEGKTELIVSPSSVRRTMQLIEAVRESARTGLTVTTEL
jgi:scyllo-inositol 2-dehydrogenase (NADP+)